jgi:hypothetical protein
MLPESGVEGHHMDLARGFIKADGEGAGNIEAGGLLRDEILNLWPVDAEAYLEMIQKIRKMGGHKGGDLDRQQWGIHDTSPWQKEEAGSEMGRKSKGLFL